MAAGTGGTLDVMCGRCVARRADLEVANLYGATILDHPVEPSYNVTPTQQVWVVLDRPSCRRQARTREI